MLKQCRFLAIAGMSALTLLACGNTEVMDTQDMPEDEHHKKSVCIEPRPQLCTMEYMPVCGSSSSAVKKTYGNACGACGDVEVVSYVAGECE